MLTSLAFSELRLLIQVLLFLFFFLFANQVHGHWPMLQLEQNAQTMPHRLGT